MAKSADYGLGPETFPRGWFIVAESKELDAGPMAVTYFGRDFALYRGQSGKPVMLDAYCAHMGTHLTASKSAMIVKNGQQIEGDSIRCPYHAWRYGPDGHVDDIPYHDGPCPKSASIRSYPVRDIMGCIMMWFDPNGAEPDFEPPYVELWDDPACVRWELDHLGTIDIHNLEILDNMADVRHLGPTHGQPCAYFENEFRDHIVIQRQGGHMQLYNADLHTVTWYTGPGLLLSKQKFGELEMYELIANTPVDDGVTKAWHGVIMKGQNVPPSAEDIAAQRQAQAGALEAFSTDFEIWKNKRSAVKIMQLKKDGPFKTVRRWVGQFYKPQEEARAVQQELNGVYPVLDFPQPDKSWIEQGFEKGLFVGKS
ncbi:MAG: Rieske 2Fe-2S domain-containing protein [Spongiibacteraceae bacterium]|jgi:3-ketosteroid 9alpha-monooxygenase subunit A|nr:Rieske 2Fe-2S domain-containing protein [Spongiibacteraceae bacterium]